MWSPWNLESSNASATKGHLELLPGCLLEIPLEVGHKGRQVWVDYIILCKPSGLVLSAVAARSGSAWPAVFRRDFAVSWQKRRVCMGLWGCRGPLDRIERQGTRCDLRLSWQRSGEGVRCDRDRGAVPRLHSCIPVRFATPAPIFGRKQPPCPARCAARVRSPRHRCGACPLGASRADMRG